MQKKTGGYEIGYVDFVDGKPVPVTSQKSILEGEGDFGPRTTGIKKYFKNMLIITINFMKTLQKKSK